MQQPEPSPVRSRATFRVLPDRFAQETPKPALKTARKAATTIQPPETPEPAPPEQIATVAPAERPARAEPKLTIVPTPAAPKPVELVSVEPEPDDAAALETPPAPKPLRSNVISFLKSSRAAARVAATGVAQASAWSAATSSTFMRTVGAWVEQKRRPRVDTLGELAEAARHMVIANRMGGIAVLSDEEAFAVRNGTPQRRVHQAGSELAVEGDVSPKPMFIMSGWACRVRICPNGRTQIIGFLLPGDSIGLRGTAEPLASTSISALTGMETVDATSLLQVAQHQQQFPGVLHALRRMYAQQEEFLMNQIVRLGTMAPEARLAHLLLELHWRLEQAGLASETEFAMPIGHETLADSTALSVKQVERAMKVLRLKNLVRKNYERVQLPGLKDLNKLSGFRAPDTSSCGRLRMMPAQPAITA